MAKEKTTCDYGDNRENINKKGNNAASGGVYGLAFIGALVYFLQHADTFWIGVLGFLKAIIWPSILIYKILEFLKM